MQNRPILVRRVNLLWYVLTLPPIVAFVYFAGSGWLPPVVFPVSVLLLLFWLCSFVFALYAMTRAPREPRQ